MLLADVAHGKDNNFNLIRFIAAGSVLISHSVVLATGAAADEPGREVLGMSLGGIAVHVFFFSSGFLVTASLLNRRSAVAFAWARGLRVLPALWIMLILCGLVLGPLLTTSPLGDYFASPRLWNFLLRGGTLVAGVAFDLPGVFGSNPYAGAVNGSLWTLPYEVYCYSLLLTIWLGARCVAPTGWRLTPLMVGFLAVSFLLLLISRVAAPEGHGWRRLMLFHMFFMGAAAYVLRHQIRLTWHRLAALLTLLALTVVIGKTAFFVVYVICMPAFVLHLAYLPGGVVRKFNRLGDYSYGIYIYAFPLQQIVVALMPGISAMELMMYSGALALVCAHLSWHAIEAVALEQRDRLILLSRGRSTSFVD